MVKTLKVGNGKHYLKIVAVKGGFNVNFFEIQKSFTGFNELTIDKLNVYPNPVSNKIVIKKVGFEYNKVKIIDIAGKIVMHKSTPYKQEFHLPIHLANGMYTVKISNKNDSQIKKIVVENK